MGKSGLRDGWDGDRVKKRCEGKWRGCERCFRGRVKIGFRRGSGLRVLRGAACCMLYALQQL